MSYSEIDTLITNFLFALSSPTPRGDLSDFERIYIINKLSCASKLNQRWLADLYIRCGCFSEANRIFQDINHWRKCGDIAWTQNDLISAEQFYEKKGENREGIVFRSGKDWDRLLKLAFHLSKWEEVIELFCQANISSCDK